MWDYYYYYYCRYLLNSILYFIYIFLICMEFVDSFLSIFACNFPVFSMLLINRQPYILSLRSACLNADFKLVDFLIFAGSHGRWHSVSVHRRRLKSIYQLQKFYIPLKVTFQTNTRFGHPLQSWAYPSAPNLEITSPIQFFPTPIKKLWSWNSDDPLQFSAIKSDQS